MTRSTVFSLAGMTGYSYPLIKMEAGAVANNLAFVEYDLALINADHSLQLVVEKLMPMVLDVLCESDPVADCQHDLLSLEHAELSRLVEWQLPFDAILSDDDSSLLRAREFERAAKTKRTLKQVQKVLDRLHEEASGERVIRSTFRRYLT